VPLRHEFASTLRVVVASIGADVGFTVDDIDDLRLAVSEVFSSFVPGAAQTAVVDMSAQANQTAVEIRMAMSADGAQTGSIDLDELAITIIRAAVDEFRIDAGVVTLVKRTDDTR
jgi:serine/threonine-protein kinase RsbW